MDLLKKGLGWHWVGHFSPPCTNGPVFWGGGGGGGGVHRLKVYCEGRGLGTFQSFRQQFAGEKCFNKCELLQRLAEGFSGV